MGANESKEKVKISLEKKNKIAKIITIKLKMATAIQKDLLIGGFSFIFKI